MRQKLLESGELRDVAKDVIANKRREVLQAGTGVDSGCCGRCLYVRSGLNAPPPRPPPTRALFR